MASGHWAHQRGQIHDVRLWDLDGTLLKGDITVEMLLKLAVDRPLLFLRSPLWLMSGRAHLKERLAESVRLNVAGLPYEPELVEFLRAQRRAARQVLLVTASHQLPADEIARHMNIPLLVIHDEDDSFVPLQFGQSIAAAWPGAKLVTTEGLGHRRILRAAHVNDLAVGFIDVQEHPVQTAA